MQDQLTGDRRTVLDVLVGAERWYTVATLTAHTGLTEPAVRDAIAWLWGRELVTPRYRDQGLHPRAFYSVTTLGEAQLANVNQLALDLAPAA